MPSQIIHVLAGRAAYRDAGVLYPSLHTAAFNLGCQGPDIFSHNRRTKPSGIAYARLLHRHDYGRFCRNFAEYLLLNPSTLGLSWLYGFVTHAATDRFFHPYIVNRSYATNETGLEGVSPALFHAFFERILDVCVLDLMYGMPVSQFDTGASFQLADDEIADLAGIIAHALVKTYPEEAGTDTEIIQRCRNAFQDAIYFYRLTNPAATSIGDSASGSGFDRFIELGIAGVSLLYPESFDRSVDWLNIGNLSWQHPVTGITSHDSVPDLFATAVSSSVLALASVSILSENDVDPPNLENLAGNGCLSVTDGEGKIAPVRFYEPFNLADILTDQAEKRRLWFAGGIG